MVNPAIAALAAVLSSAPAGAPPEAIGAQTVAAVRDNAAAARRARYLKASLGVALGGTTLAFGIYGNRKMDRLLRPATIGGIVGGSVTVGLSLIDFGVRSELERLERMPSFVALEQDPSDAFALQELQRSWAAAANRARTKRIVMASLNYAVGAGLAIAGTAFLFQANNADPVRLKGITLSGIGLGMLSAGTYEVVMPSRTEQTWSDYERAVDIARGGRRLSIVPIRGGALVAGRF